MNVDVLSKTLLKQVIRGLEGDEPFGIEIFLNKMLQAKKLEIEAIEALIPQNGKQTLYKHLKTFAEREEKDLKPIRKVTIEE